MRRPPHVLTIVIVLLCAARAAADPIPAPADRLRTRDVSTLTVASGAIYLLPPGRFIAETTFAVDEIERKRLQEAETRLTAENAAFRSTANEWTPGWKTIVTTLILGVSIGVFAATKF